MKTKVIYNHHFPTKGFVAINLFGILFFRREYGKLTPHILRHETIHTRQGVELLWIFFYPLYGLEWLVRLVQYGNLRDAYFNISFEREAYANDRDVHYLDRRRPYAFLRYLRKRR